MKEMHASAWFAGISRFSEKDGMHTKDFIQPGEEGGGGQTAEVHLSSL